MIAVHSPLTAARERAIAYRLFATLLSRETCPADTTAVTVLQAILSSPQSYLPAAEARALCTALSTIVDALPEEGGQDEFSLLAAEYDSLFLGADSPCAAPPFQSAYATGGQRPSAISEEIRVLLDELHLHPAIRCVAEDHIAVELSLMAVFIEREQHERQRAFLQDRLQRWIPVFARQVQSHARLGFYPAVMQALEILLAVDQRFLRM